LYNVPFSIISIRIIPDPFISLHAMGSCLGKNQNATERVRTETSPLKDSTQKDMQYSTQEQASLVRDSHEGKFNWDSFWQKENERFN